MAKKPLTSIIIACYKPGKDLKYCLDSIYRNTNEPFEVIVVTSQSSDKIEKRDKLKIIKLNTPTGPVKKRNLGVKLAKGKYLMFLDDDTKVASNWLSPVISYLEENSQIGAGQLKIMKMGKPSYFDSAGEKLTPFGFLSERARSTKDNGQFDQVKPIFSGKTAAMVVRKNIFDKIDGFDEDYFYYWEEPDLCWRIWKAGYQVVFMYMGKVWHAFDLRQKKPNPQKLAKVTYLGCRNHLLTIIKNGIGMRRYMMFFTVLTSWIGLSFLFLFKGNAKRFKSIYRALSWLAIHKKEIQKKREKVISNLKSDFYSDTQWLNEILVKRNIFWYLGKGISYVLNKPF